MKRHLAIVALAPLPAAAHEGHAVAAGPMGHEIAHLALGAAALAAVWLGLEGARRLVAWWKAR